MRKSVTIILFVLGIILVGLPIILTWGGFDLTPGFGIIEMVQVLTGISMLTLAGYLYISDLREDQPRSLQADIGIRLGATGLVLAYVAGLSDLIGIGTHIQPNFVRPFYGPLQLIGLGTAVAVILIGMWLYYSSRGNGRSSYFEFLAQDD